MDTKDGVTSDSEDCSLTPEQAELLTKLEGLFREFPPARQRALLQMIRSENTN
jgi:hypothetical protein